MCAALHMRARGGADACLPCKRCLGFAPAIVCSQSRAAEGCGQPKVGSALAECRQPSEGKNLEETNELDQLKLSKLKENLKIETHDGAQRTFGGASLQLATKLLGSSKDIKNFLKNSKRIIVLENDSENSENNEIIEIINFLKGRKSEVKIQLQ